MVTPSQKEFHVPSTSTSFDRRSPDMDANVPEDLSVPPPAYFKTSILPPAWNEDNPKSLCACHSIPCTCLASKPLSPIVPKFKIKKTDDGWKTSISRCENCDQPFLNSSHICDDNSDEDGILNDKMSRTGVDQGSTCYYAGLDQDPLACTCSDHEKHKMLMERMESCGVS